MEYIVFVNLNSNKTKHMPKTTSLSEVLVCMQQAHWRQDNVWPDSVFTFTFPDWKQRGLARKIRLGEHQPHSKVGTAGIWAGWSVA